MIKSVDIIFWICYITYALRNKQINCLKISAKKVEKSVDNAFKICYITYALERKNWNKNSKIKSAKKLKKVLTKQRRNVILVLRDAKEATLKWSLKTKLKSQFWVA